MTVARNLEVKFIGDASSLSRAFGTASRSADSFSGRHPGLIRGMKLVGTAALGVAGVVGGTLAVAFKQGVQSLKEHELADARTASAIKSTGAAAQVTAGQVRDYAARLEDVTSVDDVLIQQGENVLLTFTNIRNEVGAGNDIFRQATDLMVDFSVATGRDMTSAAELLGKALNDPITGMSQLRRVGVQLTEAQKEQITAFVENGQVMEAQKVLLDALKEKYEGAGAAMGNTLTGKIQKLRNKFEELGEKLATRVMPYAERFVTWLTDILDSGSVGEAVGKIGDGLGDLARKFSEWVDRVDWGSVASKIGKGLGDALKAVDWGQVISTLGEVFKGLGEGFKTALTEPVGQAYAWVVDKTADLIDTIGGAFDALGELPGDFGLFEGFGDQLHEASEGLRGFADDVRDRAKPALDEAAEAQKDWEAAIEGTGLTQSSLVASTEELQAVLDAFGWDSLAKRLGGVESQLSLNEVATLAWAASFGEVPDKKTVKALLEDKDARRALEEWWGELKRTPEEQRTDVKALGTKAAQTALDQVTSAANRIPKSRSTSTSTPNAARSKRDLDAVTTAAKNIPTSRTTKVSQRGSYETVAALGAVSAAASAIDRFITIQIGWGGSTRPPGAQHGMHNWRGGALMVGEAGPELVALPRGSDVYTNAESRRMLRPVGGPGGITWTGDLVVNGHVGSGQELAETVRRELAKVGRRNLTTGLV